MNVHKLRQRVLVCLNDADILEPDIGNEQADARRDRLFEAFRHSLCDILSCACQRKNHEDDAGDQYDDQPCLIALYAVPARDDLRQDKADEEEGIQPHAAGLCERHFGV